MKTDGHNEKPKLTEPEPIPSLFVTGFAIQISEESIARLTFWVDLPEVGDRPREARIQARVAMPDKTFRRIISEGQRIGRRGN